MLYRYGSLRSCCNRRRLPQSFLITTAGWRGMDIITFLISFDGLNVTPRLCIRFPTIRDLVGTIMLSYLGYITLAQAGATVDEVNALWKGLGYYSRASRLLAGAQKAVKHYGAKLPDNAKDMEA